MTVHAGFLKADSSDLFSLKVEAQGFISYQLKNRMQLAITINCTPHMGKNARPSCSCTMKDAIITQGMGLL